jgi:hypothetical protein
VFPELVNALILILINYSFLENRNQLTSFEAAVRYVSSFLKHSLYFYDDSRFNRVFQIKHYCKLQYCSAWPVLIKITDWGSDGLSQREDID